MKFTAQQITDAFQNHGYRLHEDGRCNTFGIRSRNSQAGQFDDWLGILRKVGTRWELDLWRATVDPGLYYLEDHLLDSSGCAILCPGQYKDTYKLDLHRGKYRALCQRAGAVKIYRDANRNAVLDRKADHIEAGWFGINVHYDGYSETNPGNVNRRASAGCQVFAVRADFYEALELWNDHAKHFANLFDYTLFDEEKIPAAAVDVLTATLATPSDAGIAAAHDARLQAIGDLATSTANLVAKTLAPPEPRNGWLGVSTTPAGIRWQLGNRRDYRRLWISLHVTSRFTAELNEAVARMLANADRYAAFAKSYNKRMPWWVVAALHEMECAGEFSAHLHNGDSLEARTVNEPKGRPHKGTPPFEWEESAADALDEKNWSDFQDWTLCDVFFRAENYNGYIYPAKGINTPYLWSGTNHYTKGKFKRDHVFDPNLVSKQPGIAALLSALFKELSLEVIA